MWCNSVVSICHQILNSSTAWARDFLKKLSLSLSIQQQLATPLYSELGNRSNTMSQFHCCWCKRTLYYAYERKSLLSLDPIYCLHNFSILQ